MWEQLAGNYRDSTVNYALLLGGIIIVLSLVVVVQAIARHR